MISSLKIPVRLAKSFGDYKRRDGQYVGIPPCCVIHVTGNNEEDGYEKALCCRVTLEGTVIDESLSEPVAFDIRRTMMEKGKFN